MNPHAKIHALKGQLHMCDEDYRNLIERETGHRSSTRLTFQQRAKVVRVMEGMLGSASSASKALEGPFAPKLQALWIAAYNLGLVRDRRDGALLTWVKGQTGIDHTRFLTAAKDARAAVEGLKKFTARAGVDWSQDERRHWLQNDDRWRIVSAQWAILTMANAMNSTPAPSIAQFIERETGLKALSKLTDRDWIAVMNALGVFVRKVKSAK